MLTHPPFKPPSATTHLWLEVSVYNLLLVHEGDGREKLLEESARLGLREAVVLSQPVQ